MKELTCPKCGNVFTVDEADYASIVSQVKNSEFESEVSKRLEEIRTQQAAQQQAMLDLEAQKNQIAAMNVRTEGTVAGKMMGE